MLLGGWSARDGAQPEAGAMQQMIDGRCSDTRLHEHRIVMRDTGKVDVTVWGNISSGVTERLMGTLGDIDTREPFTTSPVTLMSV